MNKTQPFNITMFYRIIAKHGLNVGKVFVIGVNTLNALESKSKYPIKQAQTLIKEGVEAMEKK